MHTIAYVQSCVWCVLEADRWILVREVWRRSGACRAIVGRDSSPDIARIRKVLRSNETKLIQSHYRELTAFRAVTAHQNLLSSDYESHEQRQTERRYSDEREKGGRGGWKFFSATITTLDLLDGQRGSKRFMSQFASIYLSGRQTFREGACFVAPSFMRRLVTCQSALYVSASSSCKNGQYVILESGAKILFVEFFYLFLLIQFNLIYFILFYLFYYV